MQEAAGEPQNKSDNSFPCCVAFWSSILILFACEGLFSLSVWAGSVTNELLMNVSVNPRDTFPYKVSFCTPIHAEPLCPGRTSVSDRNGQICHILGRRVKKQINAVGHFVLVLTTSSCSSTLHLHPHTHWYKHSQKGEEGPAEEPGFAGPVLLWFYLGSGKQRSSQPHWMKMPFTSVLPNESSPNQFFIANKVTAHNVSEWKVIFLDLTSLPNGMEQEAPRFE